MPSVNPCNYGLSNTGRGCVPVWKVAKKLIFVPYFNSVGVINTVSMTSTVTNLTSAFFLALRDQADPSKRWYPSPFLENAKNMRDASIMEVYDSGAASQVQAGIRKVSALIVGKDASPQLLGKILGVQTTDVGVYVIDKDNNLVGMLNTAGQLDPIRINANSFDPIYNPGDDKTEPKIALNFDVHVNEADQNINIISQSSMASGNNIGNLEGLMDVTVEFTSTGQTSMVLTLKTPYGDAANPNTVKGMLVADFISYITAATSKLRNTTTSADVTITSVTEGSDSFGRPNGVYTLAYASQTVGNVLAVSLTKSGFDFTLVTIQRPVVV